MHKKLIYCLLVLMLFTVVLAGCGENVPEEVEDTSLQDVLERGNIVVGIQDNMPPLSFIDRDEKITGYQIEIYQEIASRLGLELQLETLTGQDDMDREDIDIISDVMVSDDSQDEARYTKILNKQYLYVTRKDSDVTASTIDSLKIGISENAFNQLNTEDNELFSKNEMITFASEQEAMMQLGMGKVQVVIMDEWLAKYINLQRPSEFKWLDEKIDQGSYGITFKKSDVLLKEEVDRIIKEMKQDGFFKNLSREWFGESNINE